MFKWLLLKILAPKHHWFVGNVGSEKVVVG
jgi:hypothetical protein